MRMVKHGVYPQCDFTAHVLGALSPHLHVCGLCAAGGASQRGGAWRILSILLRMYWGS